MCHGFYLLPPVFGSGFILGALFAVLVAKIADKASKESHKSGEKFAFC